MREFKGTREACSVAIAELAQENPQVVYVFADSMKAMRATFFEEEFPSRCVDCGISEQGAVDVAAGLASCEKLPFVGTYAGFLTMRACEQMRTFVSYPNLNVKFIGINAGLVGGEKEGVSHQFYEDVGILSSIPGFTILCPADPWQAYYAVKYAATIDGPVYIRIGSGREPDIFGSDVPFSETGFRIVKDYGKDALILSTGFVLDRAMGAAELLYSRDVKVTVADVNILFEKNNSELRDLIRQFNVIVTVEDHNVNGGLQSYIDRIVCCDVPKIVNGIGLETFGESGDASELLDKYGMSSESICNKVMEKLDR